MALLMVSLPGIFHDNQQLRSCVWKLSGDRQCYETCQLGSASGPGFVFKIFLLPSQFLAYSPLYSFYSNIFKFISHK